MTLGAFALAYSLGALTSASVGIWLFLKRYEAARDNPWDTPRTNYVYAVRHYGQRAAYELQRVPSVVDEVQPATAPVDILCGHLKSEGLLLFQEGWLKREDGMHVPFNAAAQATVESLRVAFAALQEAAELLTDYADTFTESELRGHRSNAMRSITGLGAKYPFEPVIASVARTLGVDQNVLDEDGWGAALWRRTLQRWEREDWAKLRFEFLGDVERAGDSARCRKDSAHGA